MNIKFKDFFDYVKKLLDNKNSLEEKDFNDKQIEEIIRDFIFRLDKTLAENDEEKDFNEKLKEVIKTFPSVINNMKECKK